ncbi:MAG TPA: response regulator [Caulobacteraceae bacterium]|jgi:CheY-like chemotaxis protein/anti-sigma regulatory factor (Ser/Thr protein kinase)
MFVDGDSREGAAGTGAHDRFLASLSHELRTPLGGVLGMADLLARTPLTQDQKAYLDAIRDCGQHLLALVNNVLDLAKLEAGKLELHPAPLDLEALLQGVCELMSPRAHAKGLEIAWSAPANLPRVTADEGRLRQILFNLAGNAVKFTKAGGVTLSVELAREEAATVRLRFTVADTGPGLVPADLKRVFEPFGQGEAGGERAHDSTGLGLAIVDRLVQAMDGELGVDSRPGEGAAFWFEAAFPVASKAADIRPLKGLSVLVVSPSDVVRQAARAQLEASGARALLFADLAAAAVAPTGVPALIDAALRQPRQPLRPLPDRPCLVLVRPEARSLIPSCRKAGFDGYLIKPLRRSSLVSRVLAVTGADARPGAPAPAADERAKPASFAGARVLVAEDNPINALLVRSLLQREGCEAHVVGDGEEAVRAAREGRFDCILMDLRLPKLDGIAATRALRAAGVAIPIAALTADAFEEDRHACLEAGMDDFLTKPLDPAALSALLSRVASGAFTRAEAEAKLAS